jgi:hypothetical protein
MSCLPAEYTIAERLYVIIDEIDATITPYQLGSAAFDETDRNRAETLIDNLRQARDLISTAVETMEDEGLDV